MGMMKSSEEGAGDKGEGDGGEDEGDLSGLFICEEYVPKTWEFTAAQSSVKKKEGDGHDDVEDEDQGSGHTQSLTLLCSNMSCTSHDLTGQIVWPASVLLCWFIFQHHHVLEGRTVLELGAGCGLAGFFACRYASQVMITDGNDVVMRLIKQNQEFLGYKNVGGEKLWWGKPKDVLSLFGSEEKYPEYIIGADIM